MSRTSSSSFASPPARPPRPSRSSTTSPDQLVRNHHAAPCSSWWIRPMRAARRRPSFHRDESELEEAEMEATEQRAVLVAGAGRSSLALGSHLQRRGGQVLLIDRNERIGDSWRARWDSLKLYSPASRDGLPGMPFPAGRTSYP